MKPLLFVTGHAPAYRVGALARLHEREDIVLARFGGRSHHGGADFAGELPFPHVDVHPHELFALAAGGDYRAVVCPTGGRLAPLETWAGARRGGIPLILWASLWAHPRSLPHAATYLPLARLYRSADAVVTYGPHVSAYVSARGARNVHVAPQSVDNDFWRSPGVSPPNAPDWPASEDVRFLFVGRATAGKGLGVLLDAWGRLRTGSPSCALVLAGDAAQRPPVKVGATQERSPVVAVGGLAPRALRDVYAACDVLIVPSVATRTFREPWGLVINEAMDRGLAVIATYAVGAAAGGLVRDGANGLVVPAGDPRALGDAIERLRRDPSLRAELGAVGARDVLSFSHEAWADGFSRALRSVGVSRSHC